MSFIIHVFCLGRRLLVLMVLSVMTLVALGMTVTLIFPFVIVGPEG